MGKPLFPDIVVNGTTLVAADIAAEAQNHHAPKGKPGLAWLRRETTEITGQWKATDVSGDRGVKFDLVQLLDIDEDGDLDILTCEERDQLGVLWYENPAR